MEQIIALRIERNGPEPSFRCTTSYFTKPELVFHDRVGQHAEGYRRGYVSMKVFCRGYFWAGASASFLAACGGGGGDSSMSFIDPMTLPTSGAATYTDSVDILVAEEGGNLTLSGDLTMNVTFGADTVTGDVSNFTDSASNTYTGDFDLTDGSIDRTVPADEFALAADLDGEISRNGSDVSYGSTGSAFVGGDFFVAQGDQPPGEVRGNFGGFFRRVEGGTPTQAFIDQSESAFIATQ
ncbi:hypothetical protein [Yoonia sp. 2307UL14-13]|uniref:hypothetical protein n=1 Tax=Yoonia sp. 2307UL14-13 TaxID=3126506 RepID=UPI0030B1A5B2